MKIVSIKQISLTFALSTLIVGGLSQPGCTMESTVQPFLDHKWTWKGAPNLMDVIGMSTLNTHKENRPASENTVRVAVIDSYVNPEAVDLSQSCDIQAPDKYDFTKNYHGTHVGKIIEKISPDSHIHNYSKDKIIDSFNRIAKNDKIDVINMSIGFAELLLQDSDAFKAMMLAINSGKIIVRAMGNRYNDENNKIDKSNHDSHSEKLMSIAERPEMKGRLLLVVNADYPKGNESICTSSTRPIRPCKYAITAPGTNITAYIGNGINATCTGTSMAAPIVSGVIAQLLFDLHEHRKLFVENGLGSDHEFKDFIVKAILENARKMSLQGEKLGIEFGQGVIHYKNAYDAICAYFVEKEEIRKEEARKEEFRKEEARQRTVIERANEISLIRYLINEELNIANLSEEDQYKRLIQFGGVSEGDITFAIHQEAARQETARQEAARQEAARQEAARQEAARKAYKEPRRVAEEKENEILFIKSFINEGLKMPNISQEDLYKTLMDLGVLSEENILSALYG